MISAPPIDDGGAALPEQLDMDHSARWLTKACAPARTQLLLDRCGGRARPHRAHSVVSGRPT